MALRKTVELEDYIRDIPDFPKDGIIFKDITPLLQDRAALREAIITMKDYYQDMDIDYIAGVEARGFLIGTPLALELNMGFIPIRKAGKLPYEKISASYDLEYGSNELEIHKDALEPGDNILLIDDLLATGGTTRAAVELIENLGGKIINIGFLLELTFLRGRELLRDYDIYSLIKD